MRPLRACHRIPIWGAAVVVAWQIVVASASVSRCQARVSSLRATAVVAIFFPRRLAMAWKPAANCGGSLGRLRRLAQHPAQPHRAFLGDVAVVGDAVGAADGGG